MLDPGQIARLYWALRKGREDSRGEPGAADYGEMEIPPRNAVQLTAWDHCCRRPAPDWPVLLGLALRGRVKREATRFDRRRLIVIPRKVGDAIPRYSILTN